MEKNDVDLPLALAMLTKGVLVAARRLAIRAVSPVAPVGPALTATPTERWSEQRGPGRPDGTAPAAG